MPAYDCSHTFEDGMPVYPDDDPVRISMQKTLPEDGSRIRRLSFSSHTGTHIDAPSHKIPDGRTLSEFDVSAFRFSARLVDCTPCDDRERLTVECLPETLRRNPEKPAENVMLVFRTGWSTHWGSERYRDSPYVDSGLAEWCVQAGYHIGLDTFSPDPVPSTDPDRESPDEPDDQPAHAALCASGRFIVENLRGLDRLPLQFTLETQPLPIADGDGSPVRAIAHTSE